MAPTEPSRTRWVKPAVAAVAVVTVVGVFWWAWDREAIDAWKEQASPLTFFAAMAILPAIGLPVTPFYILAGATFGPKLGVFGSVMALAANLALTYWAARKLRRPVEALLRRFDYHLPDFDEPNRSATRFTLATKVAPGIPAFIKQYGLGIAGVPFGVYFWWSILISGIYAAALVLLGQSLLNHRLDQVMVPAVALGALALVVWWLRRK